MKRFVTAVAAVVLIAGVVSAQDNKVDPAKLVGKWEVTKSEVPNLKGSAVEFTKDGKLTVMAVIEGMKVEFVGTYSVDGDQLKVTLKPKDGGKENTDTDTIKSLADDKIVLVDKDKKETELTKKK